jgi:hypothetical protein
MMSWCAVFFFLKLWLSDFIRMWYAKNRESMHCLSVYMSMHVCGAIHSF